MIEKLKEFLSNQQYKELKNLLAEANEADIAEVFDEFDTKENLAICFRLLNKDEAADIFSRMDENTQEALIETLSESEVANIISKMYIDDAADLLEELPANLVTKVLKNTNASKRKEINEILKYPEDSAGSIMTTEYIELKANDTVGAAFDKIRKTGLKKETVYTAYITDSQRHLIGVTTVKDMMMVAYETLIQDVMEEKVITVSTVEDKEEVAKMFDKYDFMALPVIDSENRLVGIVTVDDALDVMSEESEEDFSKMAAVVPSEDDYLKESIFTQYKNRIIWLLIFMISSIFTGKIITHFELALSEHLELIAFIPMVMNTGGNCGSQASTMIIRALATDEINPKDIFKVWFKEIRIAMLAGITLAIVNFARIWIIDHDIILGLVTGATLFLTAILAKSLGCILPILAKCLKLDPAYMASPMITTLVDAGSLIIFFNVALLIMNI